MYVRYDLNACICNIHLQEIALVTTTTTTTLDQMKQNNISLFPEDCLFANVVQHMNQGEKDAILSACLLLKRLYGRRKTKGFMTVHEGRMEM